MSEKTRLEKVKRALQNAMVKTVEAEGWLEDAAGLAETGSAKADDIWDLKRRLDRLGVEILELSKTDEGES